VWLDQRTAGVVANMKDKNDGNVDVYRETCGLPINTYFSAQKMKWMLENVDGLGQNENLIFGTIDTYLIAKLTNFKTIVTDSTNASRTMLMDINTLEWSQKMLDEYGIQAKWLPNIIKESSADFGTISTEDEGLANVKGV
jgi:glycerol kinase